MPEKKIGILVDEDFALLHVPPYPKPSFISFENPQRIRSILDHLDIKDLFKDKRVQKLNTIEIEENLLLLAHTRYHIEAIKRISNLGGGFLGDEVFITENSFNLSKKAVGGCIRAVESVLNNEVTSSFALVRPPGHHALRETSSGLCIFNNIAVTIQYLREIKHYNENVAIIDIDNHFGDGLAQYFYDDPSVLYFSIHEYDFMEGDIGLFNELGQEEGLGRNINFPVPPGVCNDEFLVLFEIIEPILFEFKPGLILIAAGFDMYHADPIGNCRLTSKGYQEFSKRISSRIIHTGYR